MIEFSKVVNTEITNDRYYDVYPLSLKKKTCLSCGGVAFPCLIGSRTSYEHFTLEDKWIYPDYCFSCML